MAIIKLRRAATAGASLAYGEMAIGGNELYFGNSSNLPVKMSKDGHTHTFASLTSKPTTLSGFGITDGAVDFGSRANTATTTANFIALLTSWGMFNYGHAFCKFSWSYAGNEDITDITTGSVEIAGAVCETWQNGDGTKMVRLICPNTGTGNAYREFIYNDQGAGYSPGWREVWNSRTLTNLNQLTNGPGYITGITSGMVTAALGFTPYNSTNPSGFITSTDVEAAIGNYDTTYASITYQPKDADLTAIAGLSGTSGFLKKTAANTWSLDTSTYLTAHPTITMGTNTTTTSSPGYAGTFTAIDSITKDSNGHVTAINTKTVTMPSAQSIPTVNDGTLTLSTTGIATGSATFTANQSGNSTFTVNVPATNIGYTASTRVLTSSTGTGFTIPEVVAAGNSGLMTGADKTKLNGIATGATANTGTVTSVSAGTQISGMTMTITNGSTTASIATSISNAASFRSAIGAGIGTVTSVSGTTNQISVANGTTTPVISIPSTFIAPGTIQSTSTVTVGSGTAAWSINGSSTNMNFTAPGGRIITLTGGTGTKTIAFTEDISTDYSPKYASIGTASSSTFSATSTYVNGVIISTYAGAQTITISSGLPIGSQMTIVRQSSNASNVTITRSGSESINGATSVAFSGQYKAVTLIKYNSTSWIKVGA